MMALPLDVSTGLFIDGAFRSATNGEEFAVINPATGDVLANVANGSPADAQAAVEAAANAQIGWADKMPRERGEILRRAFELMITKEQQLAELITLENGKALPDSIAEVRYAAEFFRWFSEEGVRNLGSLSVAPSTGARILVHHKPAGVAILVTPWNFPAAMGTRKIAPALAAGCTCVLKPAAETPLTMLALAQILQDAGVPKGVVNILPSQHSGEVVAKMLSDPRSRVISFTGSTQVGRILLQEASKWITNPRMELGGNAPFLVFDDADINSAVEGAMIAKMRNMGEACTAANRFYVHQKVYKEFSTKFAQKMGELRVGNGLDLGVAVGPLINAKTRDKVAFFVDDAVAKGARILVGGRRGDDEKGYFYLPTVLVDVPNDAKCLSEEIFGPVAPICSFSDEKEVIKAANATEYGLAAYVFTRDLKRGLRISEQLEYGMVGLNRGVMSDPAAPFGGVKQSGLGREGAHEGLLEFLETQYISTDW